VGSWPLITRVDRVADAGSVLASTTWTTVTAGGINAKGSYSQLIASTSFASDAFVIGIKTATSTVNFLVDLAVGAAAAEQVILPNVMFRSGGSLVAPFTILYVPIHILSGQRISARCQSPNGGSTCTVGVYLFGAS
jgi:hypothetical protein